MTALQQPTAAAMDADLHRVADRLASRYAGRADIGDIERSVFEEAERYRDARVTKFVPVLVEHAVREQLRTR
jgi:hypothetical protein